MKKICAQISGAKIQDLQSIVGRIGDKPGSHMVVMAGTNNLKSNTYVEIMASYKKLISELKQHSYRRISMIGILRRKDVGGYLNSKRIGINLSLKDLCQANDICYLDRDITVGQLSNDGLHLSAVGQDEVAREIFRHCKKYLN